jgi:antitoxin VapB
MWKDMEDSEYSVFNKKDRADNIFIKKSGNVVMPIPVKNSWDSLLNSLDKFSDDFMSERK